ncbi:MAG: DUF5131 family protein [Lewinellaceae bacterium]|nr:DUF5131 family protein [Lewinellaceae bacterium]
MLGQTGAHVKFLSLEPLIGPLQNLNLDSIDWVIVGGESGRKPRPMKPEWVQEIPAQCKARCLFQTRENKSAGRLLGKTMTKPCKIESFNKSKAADKHNKQQQYVSRIQTPPPTQHRRRDPPVLGR